MTRTQRLVSTIACVLVAVMAAVPPWQFVETGPMARSEAPAGYHLIFSPPAPRDPSFTSTMTGVSLDLGRLAVQCLVVCGLAAALTLVLGLRSLGTTGSRRPPN